MGLHLAYLSDGVSLCNFSLDYTTICWSGEINFPYNYLTVYQYLIQIVLPFRAPKTIAVAHLPEIPWLALPWLDTIYPGIFLTFHIICSASTTGHMQMLPNLSSACLLVPHETWPLTSVLFLEWSCSLCAFNITLMTWVGFIFFPLHMEVLLWKGGRLFHGILHSWCVKVANALLIQ